MQTLDVESSRRTPESPCREHIIGAELIRAQYGNMPGAFIGSAVTASFMAAVLYDRLPSRTVLPWLIAAYVNCAIRVVLWKWFQYADPTVAAAPRWGQEDRNGLPVLHHPFHAGRLRTLINNLIHAPVARARRAT
jgi:hypothetical protein